MIVQADLNSLNQLKAILVKEGYTVATAVDGDAASKRILSQPPQLVVFEMGQPGPGGFEVCRQIRDGQGRPQPSLLAITAGAGETESAFAQGADDCVSKPVNLPELVVRVRRLVRAKQVTTVESDAEEIAVDELRLDIPRHQATVDGQRVHLTSTEFKLLRVLAQRRGRVQSRECLLQDVWQYNRALTTRTVDTHMARLRSKLGSSRRYLEVVRGIGYRFAEA